MTVRPALLLRLCLELTPASLSSCTLASLLCIFVGVLLRERLDGFEDWREGLWLLKFGSILSRDGDDPRDRDDVEWAARCRAASTSIDSICVCGDVDGTDVVEEAEVLVTFCWVLVRSVGGLVSLSVPKLLALSLLPWHKNAAFC